MGSVAEGSMRVVAIFVAALLTLGLAAFGIIISQRGNVPSLANLLPSRTAPTTASAPQAAQARASGPVAQPVTQVAQATVSDAPSPVAAPAEPAAPAKIAQNSVTPDRFQQSMPPAR